MLTLFTIFSHVRDHYKLRLLMVVNGSQLPIHNIGDVNSSARDVFVSPELSTSLN